MNWIFETVFTFLQTDLTLSTGLAIIGLTVLIRLLLLPISFPAIVQGIKQRQQLNKFKPQIDKLKQQYQSDPSLLSQKLMQFYKDNSITFVNKTNLMNMLGQGITGFGMFQFLNSTNLIGKFAWISDIAKSDVLLSVAVALLTGLSMYLMPSAAESVNYLMLIVVSGVCLVSLLNFSSVIGLYWGTSTLVSTIQSFTANLIHSRKILSHG
ncbi:YidC/Oxa1 family membrane protein insertase [Shewanella sp. 202IG2-18]|uniref:YidC/Oxa1 family membrane protein insertase n=1 Tax=Parashewanella hymeniacidonis TaxID=2807618 RepID=UPI001960CA14|nr:YidC/Oxa1 family membrane protein insertase [Parashewanella hymeniacidonis]MBM7073437.1 YidC/Oxa1 family membrane protein insertase [Parashewanella hymeniacidonis]